MTDDTKKPDSPLVAALKRLGFKVPENTGEGLGQSSGGPPKQPRGDSAGDG
jgi:hypothetical protein